MVDFRRVTAANQSDTEYRQYGTSAIPDREFGNLEEAMARVAQAQENESPAETARLLRQNRAALEQMYPDTEFGDLEGAMRRVSEQTVGETISDIDDISTQTIVIEGKRIQKSRKNPLDDYANYTYGLSLHIIPISTYNSLAKQGGGGYSPGNNVLIASAGRHDQTGFGRRANFKEDFYFENLKFTTVIGYNSRNRGSNVIDVSFTIIEPYGISLLDRLLKVATDEGAQNWNQMPFMLQIDFYGNTDDGDSEPIEGHTKYIPIKLIACNIKASTRGSEYRFTAVPYNHQAFHETVGSAPAMLAVIAKTVGEFFKGGDENAGQAGAILNEENYFKTEKENFRRENKLDARDNPESLPGYTDILQQEKDAKSTAFKVGSYAAALNVFQEQLKTNGHQEHADRYEFIIDSKIAGSAIVDPNKNNVKSTPMATINNNRGKMVDGLRARLTGGSVPVTTDKQIIAINAGTSIIDVINLALRNSKYISEQVDPTKSSQVSSKPIEFYKIIPEIEIGPFDNKRKTYQKTFRYYIKKYSYYNTRYPGAMRGVPVSWEKEYNYMYTGKNNSILDFNIEFDAMFYTAMTANAANFKKGEVDASDPESDEGGGNEAAGSNRLAVNVLHYYSNQTWTGTDAVGNNDVKNIGANDLYQSIMTNSRGDMINVKLKITGDPELIKQDDYYSDLGKSIPMDAGEIFAYLNFRSPSDIDQDVGMYDFSSYPQSVFAGIYKIIVVENTFERGQFIQTLDLIRLMEQKESQPRLGTNSSNSPEERPNLEISDNKSVALNEATEESLRRMNFGKIIPGGESTALYAEDGTLSRSRINTETGEAFNPVVESSDGQNYFERLKQIKNKVSDVPIENRFLDDRIWSTGAGP